MLSDQFCLRKKMTSQKFLFILYFWAICGICQYTANIVQEQGSSPATNYKLTSEKPPPFSKYSKIYSVIFFAFFWFLNLYGHENLWLDVVYFFKQCLPLFDINYIQNIFKKIQTNVIVFKILIISLLLVFQDNCLIDFYN